MSTLPDVLARAIDHAGPGRLLIAVGVVCLLNPLYIGVLHLDEPEWYRYEAAELHLRDDGSLDGPLASVNDPDVACLNRAWRDCLFEQHVLDSGDVPVTGAAWMARNSGTGHEYAYLDGQFYETTAAEQDGRQSLALEPLDSTQAIAFASTPLDEAIPPVRRAIGGATVTTRQPLAATGHLLQDTDGTFYVLVRVASHSLGEEAFARAQTEERIVEIGLMTLLGAVGLGLVLRGQRIRIEW